jgi:hypothetical protein
MGGPWTYRVSAAGVLVLAAAAFTLSYDALHQLALDSRVRPGLAWLWPVVIDGTIVVALLTVLAAKRAAAGAGYPWMLAGLFSAASVAFNIAHAPDRPVAQLVFAMAPGRAGAHHPPAHAAGQLAAPTADPQGPGCTRGRTAGRARPRTPAPAGRPPRTAAGVCGTDRTGWRACPGPGGLPGAAGGRADPDRRRPGPGRWRQRAVWATSARRVHRRPRSHRQANGDGRPGGHQPDHDDEGR